MTGPDLRQRRQAAHVSQTDLARETGISRQTIWSLEGRVVLPDDLAQRYLSGLETILQKRAS